MSPLNLFYYNGLLVIRVFGSPGDQERLTDASVHLQRGSPSRLWPFSAASLGRATQRAPAWRIC